MFAPRQILKSCTESVSHTRCSTVSVFDVRLMSAFTNAKPWPGFGQTLVRVRRAYSHACQHQRELQRRWRALSANRHHGRPWFPKSRCIVIVSSVSTVFVIHTASFHSFRCRCCCLSQLHKFPRGENTRKWLHVRGVPKMRGVRTRGVFGHLWHFYIFTHT